MWSILALGAAETLINRIIDLDAITRIQFNHLEGKMLRVVMQHPVLSVDVYFDEDRIRFEPTATGQASQASVFEQRPYDAKQQVSDATATLSVDTAVDALKLLLAAPEEIGRLPIQGDYRLLQQLQQILQQLQPDLAAHLTPWLGANVAHEIGALFSAPRHIQRSAQNSAFYLKDWLKEDSGLFAARWQWDQLSQATRQLQQNLDRLEAKLKRFSTQE